MKKVIGVLCCIALVITFLLPIKQTSALSKIDPELLKLGLASKQVKGIFVEFDKPTVVMESTFGGQKVFNSRELIRQDNQKTKMLERSISNWQNRHFDSVKKAIPEAKIVDSYMYAFNGYYVEIPMNKIELLASNPQVKRIFVIQPKKIYRTRTRALLGAEKTWATVKDPSGRPVDGSGVLVSVSDTGLDYSIPDLGGQKNPVGDKVVISRDLGEGDNDCQEDERGFGTHGTECASLIAGDGPDNKETNQKEKGIAPKALLAGYKVTKYLGKEEGLVFDDASLMRAWDVMIQDKVDVSNNSYGKAGGFPDYEEQQLNCALAGVTVVVANGNEGSPGGYLFPIPQCDVAAANSVIGVGATDDLDRSDLTIFKSPDQSYQNRLINGYWLDNKAKFSSFDIPVELVDCLWGRPVDFNGIDVKDKIALITIGPNDKKGNHIQTISEQVDNARMVGARAVILQNDYYGIMNQKFEEKDKNDHIPTYGINWSDGKILSDMLHSNNQWKYGTVDTRQNEVTITFSKPTYKGKIADFSSSGPSKRGFLKPDVCAPGEGIHAALPTWISKIIKEQYDDEFGGTSAASPFVAGCAALITQGRSEWNPFEIKRSLMNTATLLKRMDGQYYYPLTEQGMGRVDVSKAITSQILVQPPSALILADGITKRIADKPDELNDPNQTVLLPKEVSSSTMPLKLFNYSTKPMNLDLSFEVNSANPSQFEVNLTAAKIVVPPASKTPGTAWVGLNIAFPPQVEGYLNDVIIWIKDNTSGSVIHMGVCIFNNDPSVNGNYNTFITNLKFDKQKFSPNNDGVEDQMTISFDVTNGSWNWEKYSLPCYLNEAEMLTFYVNDANGSQWALIKIIDVAELGPNKFVWDGRDYRGNYILPDGDWTLSVYTMCDYLTSDMRHFYRGLLGYDLAPSFSIEKSTVPPVPTISSYIIPVEPGVGQEFQIGIYIKNAKNIQGLTMNILMPGLSRIAQYTGYEKTEFSTANNPKTDFSLEYDKDKEQFYLNIHPGDSTFNDNGWLIKLKFLALEPNVFDVIFNDMKITIKDTKKGEIKTRAYSNGCEVVISKQAYDVCDFNRDGKVDDSDKAILAGCLGSKDGDPGYKWRCDLNYDWVIDFSDYAIFARTYKQ